MKEQVSTYILYLYKDFALYSAKVLKKYNINFGQLPFLIYIGKNDGTTLKELKSKLDSDWGYSQRVIDKLIKDKFVRKENDINDKRVYHLYLTFKGKEAFNVSHDVFKTWDTLKLKEFNDYEKVTLLKLLKKLVPEAKISE